MHSEFAQTTRFYPVKLFHKNVVGLLARLFGKMYHKLYLRVNVQFLAGKSLSENILINVKKEPLEVNVSLLHSIGMERLN